MDSRRRFLALFGLALSVLFTACGNNEAKPASTAPKSIEERFAIKVGGRTLQLQVALQPVEMQLGLMYRKTLGAEEGMVFVYGQPQQMSFWMRNTVVPLDIGFFDGTGELKEIYPLHPHDERPVASRGRMHFALEVNQGWFSRAGIKPGAKLDLVALAEAVRARGVRPDMLGLR
jgi:uncharacterized membrane protein (UPF0127 family)